MKIVKGKNWFKYDFDKYYLITNYRSLFNKEILEKEISGIINVLKENNFSKNCKILDLHGGFGRIAMALYRKGFKNLTVFDLSRFLIEYGKKIAKKNDLKINFVCDNSLNLLKHFKENDFDVVLIIANSFGYMGPENDFKIMKNIYHVLSKNGLFLLDTVLSNTLPDLSRNWFSTPNNNYYILREGRVIENKNTHSFVETKEILLHKKFGIIRKSINYFYWYSKDTYKRISNKIGFKLLKIITPWLVLDKSYRSLSYRSLLVFKK